MYIRKIEIKNIKGFKSCVIDFSKVNKPGWHVLIGDNGSGKTTLLRCFGLGMLEDAFPAVFAWDEFRNERWRGKASEDWRLFMEATENGDPSEATEGKTVEINYLETTKQTAEHWNLNSNPGDQGKFRFGFASGYGPFRMLSGVNSSGRGGSSFFSTLFAEEEGLSERALEWLIGLKLGEDESENMKVLNFVIDFINTSKLLPVGVTFTNKFGTGGIKFRDAAGTELYIPDASAGFRTMFTLSIDLIKNLIAYLGLKQVEEGYIFDEVSGQHQFKLSGVVLIDEVDAHLHPTWQTRIGKWFTEHFPLIQFIVTTHSPLICRGAAKGTIWKLPTLGTGKKVTEIKGPEKDKLVYGTVLDAYETDEFGEVTRGEEGKELQEIYRALKEKRRYGNPMTAQEKKELDRLNIIFQGNVEVETKEA